MVLTEKLRRKRDFSQTLENSIWYGAFSVKCYVNPPRMECQNNTEVESQELV